jgi:hypothetical protein
MRVVGGDDDSEFVGEPFLDDEARGKWPKRYQRARYVTNNTSSYHSGTMRGAAVLC